MYNIQRDKDRVDREKKQWPEENKVKIRREGKGVREGGSKSRY